MPVGGFQNIRLPEAAERGFAGGPGFNNTIKTGKDGTEKRNQNWDQQRGHWTVRFGRDVRAVYEGILAVFQVSIGDLHSFLFKDWIDYTIPRQIIGATDTATTDYQIFKTYTVMTEDIVPVPVTKNRTIVRPKRTTVQVWVNAVEIFEGAGASQFTVDYLTGIITLGSTLAAQSGTDVEVACEFFSVVRFALPDFDVELTWGEVGEVPAFQLVEVKGE
jgi:uncharacterized protein (TIGR02217 family)